MLRKYQVELASRCYSILKTKKIVYLAASMRIGKTLVALETAKLLEANNVLFLTKKMAINSILFDYKLGNYKFNIKIINYEQAHKLKPIYDLIIVDEAHSLGAFPLPSKRTKLIRNLVKNNYLMLLSGTPAPESYSQLYHQFWISYNSPFLQKNFYHWANSFVNIQTKYIGMIQYKDYRDAKQQEIMEVIDDYFVRFTQKDAGFIHSEVNEIIIPIKMIPQTYQVANRLIRDRYYYIYSKDEIICNNATHLLNKLHQIYSGTIIAENDCYIIDYSKAEYIKDNYKGAKIAVYYKYKLEGEMLRKVLDYTTQDPEEFKENKRCFISQIQSGSMGIDLSFADILIFFNIDFSATLYWQARARIQSINRIRAPKVHWLFSQGGIENRIYRVVQKKKNYTLSFFKKDYFLNEKILNYENFE